MDPKRLSPEAKQVWESVQTLERFKREQTPILVKKPGTEEWCKGVVKEITHGGKQVIVEYADTDAGWNKKTFVNTNDFLNWQKQAPKK